MRRSGFLIITAIIQVVTLALALSKAQSVPLSQETERAQQGLIKRLILIDGSYELIGQYSVEAERVRYYSAERFAWEEMPYSMVDWVATKEYASRSVREKDERTAAALENASRERRETDAHLPLVAPGLRIPAPDGVFLLDIYQGKPAWNKLAQNGGDLNKNTGSNILRGIINPVAGSKQTVELKGRKAGIQSHIVDPTLYFGIDPTDPAMGYNSETAEQHLRIARCQEKGGNRIVATIEIAVYGKVRQKIQYVEASVERISDYWVKIIPSKPMKSGEYALVELDEKGVMNQFVWDFGVDTSAPPNPATLVGEPEKKEPVLIQKPRKATSQ